MVEKRIYLFLLILHAFVGIGALFGGSGIIIDPSGKFYGITVEVLKNSPFQNFLIPGLILFFIIGLGNVIVAILALKNNKYQAYFSGVMGCALMIWIIVQCIMIEDINSLHIIFFLLGLIEALLALLLAFKQNLFPLNYLKEKK